MSNSIMLFIMVMNALIGIKTANVPADLQVRVNDWYQTGIVLARDIVNEQTVQTPPINTPVSNPTSPVVFGSASGCSLNLSPLATSTDSYHKYVKLESTLTGSCLLPASTKISYGIQDENGNIIQSESATLFDFIGGNGQPVPPSENIEISSNGTPLNTAQVSQDIYITSTTTENGFMTINNVTQTAQLQ